MCTTMQNNSTQVTCMFTCNFVGMKIKHLQDSIMAMEKQPGFKTRCTCRFMQCTTRSPCSWHSRASMWPGRQREGGTPTANTRHFTVSHGETTHLQSDAQIPADEGRPAQPSHQQKRWRQLPWAQPLSKTCGGGGSAVPLANDPSGGNHTNV